ncbi:MAG: Fic family protein [Candidatus Nitrosoabyssus spongiisocia]|nr:MAG: Fic family protein [Nitrosopumilaceae archaeon AB1(1)]
MQYFQWDNQKGLLDSIVKRPNLKIDNEFMYDNIFLKASCILEGIIRWHPFADGNKRHLL